MLSPVDPVTPHGPLPGLPKTPEQPILPPDDPRRPDLDREPEGDPPSIDPPVILPSEHPGITEPPSPRARAFITTVMALAVAVSGAVGGAACARAETSQAAVTTTSPAGQSTAPSSAALERRDEALVRVVHAIPAGAPIDIYAGDLTGYEELEPLNGQIEIRGEGQPAALATLANVHIEAGRFYTVVVVGTVRSTPKLEAFLIEDAPTPATRTR